MIPNYNAVPLLPAPTSNFLLNKALLVISENPLAVASGLRIQVVQGRMDNMFPCLTVLSSELDVTKDKLFSTIHLDLLNEKFMYYFANETRDTECIVRLRNPFEVDVSKTFLSSEDESKLIELSCNRSLKSKCELAEFWLHISKEYIVLSEGNKCLVVLLSFTRHTV